MTFADKALGKSIANVFEKTAKKEHGRGYLEVAIDSLMPPKANPRKRMTDTELQELAESIRTYGILQPIVVMKIPGGYEVLAGERRYRAARIAGLATVPVVVRSDYDDQEVAELRLIENLQREDLNAIEVANAYQELLSRFALTQEALAQRIGVSRSSIANSVRLLSLDTRVQDLVVTGTLSMGHAKVLVAIEDPDWQYQLASAVVNEHLSVRELEMRSREHPTAPMEGEEPALSAAGESAGKRKTRQKPSHIKELEESLSVYLGQKVEIKEKRGRGVLSIHFQHSQELNRLIETMHSHLDASRHQQPPA